MRMHDVQTEDNEQLRVNTVRISDDRNVEDMVRMHDVKTDEC